MQKLTDIIARTSVLVTAVWFIMALFDAPGIDWYMLLIPIPLALAVVIILYIGQSIYEQIRRK